MGFEDPRSGNGHVIAQVVLEQLGVPAGGPAAAVGVVAVGSGQAVAVGQAHGRAVAGDVPGIAFNAQAVTVAAQIAAAEASGRAAGGHRRQRGRQDAGPPSAADGGRAGRGHRTVGRQAGRGTMPRRAGRQGCRPSGGGRGPAPDGPAGMMAVRPGRAGAVRSVRRTGWPSLAMGMTPCNWPRLWN